MGTRIDDLEKNIADLMTQAGVNDGSMWWDWPSMGNKHLNNFIFYDYIYFLWYIFLLSWWIAVVACFANVHSSQKIPSAICVYDDKWYSVCEHFECVFMYGCFLVFVQLNHAYSISKKLFHCFPFKHIYKTEWVKYRYNISLYWTNLDILSYLFGCNLFEISLEIQIMVFLICMVHLVLRWGLFGYMGCAAVFSIFDIGMFLECSSLVCCVCQDATTFWL